MMSEGTILLCGFNAVVLTMLSVGMFTGWIDYREVFGMTTTLAVVNGLVAYGGWRQR
jgi:hypothetical protein